MRLCRILQWMSEQPSLPAFFKAFGQRWLSIMSGALSVPFSLATLLAEQSAAKAVFVTLAIVSVWVSAYLMWANERSRVLKLELEADDKAIRKKIREQLGEFVRTATSMQERVGFDPAGTASEIPGWIGAVESYLIGNLDGSYAARFISNSGLPGHIPSVSNLVGYSSDIVRNVLNAHLAWLNEFIKELA